jgi:hypothetical protein
MKRDHMRLHSRRKCAFTMQRNMIWTRYFLLPHIFVKKSKHFVYLLVNMAELTEFERGIIIGGWLFGHSEREIEKKTGLPKSTIHDTIERYEETGLGTSRPRSGRPPILTDRDKRYIVRPVRSDRQQSATQSVTTS